MNQNIDQKMKNILFLMTIGYPSCNQGGGSKIIHELLKEIDGKMFNCDFLSYDLFLEADESINIDKDLQKNLSLRKKITNKLFENSGLYRKLTTNSLYLTYYFSKQEKYFKRMLERKNWEIVHAHDNISMAYLPDSPSIKKILSIHSKGPYRVELTDDLSGLKYFMSHVEEFNSRENLSIDKADVVVFPSKQAKEMFLSQSTYKKFDRKDIRIVYNGIDLDFINSIRVDRKILEYYGITGEYEEIVLNVAAHVQPKNISILIDSMNVLVNQLKKNVCLINIGTGNGTLNLQKKIGMYSLERNVKLLGKIPNEDVIKIMKAADLFVMPSSRVVFDMVILEALACGCCILASKEGGNVEVITDGVNGYLLDTITVEEIVDKILNLDKTNTKQNALETAKQFTSKRMAEEYTKIYNQLL